MDWLIKLQSIDRRYMYVLLVVLMVLPMLFNLSLPISVSREVQGVYDAIEKVPQDKLVVLTGDWGAGTLAESRPQSEALMRHLFRRNIKFAILPLAPQTATLFQKSADKVAKEFNKKYGRDYVNWGWKPQTLFVLLKSLAENVPTTIKTDVNGTPVEKIECMEGIRDIKDIGLIAHVTSVGNLQIFIGFIQQVYGTPLVYCPTAVIVAQGYDPLDAKQIVGMLPGVVGAAQYETLLGIKSDGLKWSNALSFAELLMVVLIILGNIGYLAMQRRKAMEANL